MSNNDYETMSTERLQLLLNNINPLGIDNPEVHKMIAELEKRHKIKDAELKSQFSTSIHWSRIAAIAAILGTIFVFAQIVIYFLESNNKKTSTSTQIQLKEQNIQQPTKSRASLTSSLSSSTYATPSKKQK